MENTNPIESPTSSISLLRLLKQWKDGKTHISPATADNWSNAVHAILESKGEIDLKVVDLNELVREYLWRSKHDDSTKRKNKGYFLTCCKHFLEYVDDPSKPYIPKRQFVTGKPKLRVVDKSEAAGVESPEAPKDAKHFETSGMNHRLKLTILKEYTQKELDSDKNWLEQFVTN